MQENFNIVLHVSKQGVGAIASQFKIQPVKSDNMSRWTSYTDTWVSMGKKKKKKKNHIGICFCSN